MDENEQQIEELKNALRTIMEMIVARNAPMPDDLKVLLAQVTEHVATRIQELRQQGISPPQTPPIEPPPISSSNINSFGYDDKTGKLLVKFQGDYPQQNGPVYAYEGVPKQIFELFKRGAVPARTDGKNAWGEWWKGKVPSLGASMYTLIKGGAYPYQRLT